MFPPEPDTKLVELPNKNVDELSIKFEPSNCIRCPDALPIKACPEPERNIPFPFVCDVGRVEPILITPPLEELKWMLLEVITLSTISQLVFFSAVAFMLPCK